MQDSIVLIVVLYIFASVDNNYYYQKLYSELSLSIGEFPELSSHFFSSFSTFSKNVIANAVLGELILPVYSASSTKSGRVGRGGAFFVKHVLRK